MNNQNNSQDLIAIQHALELYRKGQPQAAALYWNAAKNLLTNR